MLIKVVEGANHRFGKTDDYYALSVRIEPHPVFGSVFVSAWEPTPEELKRLNAGAHVLLYVCGRGQPPVGIEVGNIPNEPVEGEKADG